MGHSDIGVTLNTYTHLGLEDAEDELKRVKGLEDARKEMDKAKGKKRYRRKCSGQFNRKDKALCFGRAFFCNLCVIFYAGYGIINF